jgi:hypothetical protein
MSGLNAGGLIRITSSIAPQGLVKRETGRTLFFTKDKTIPMQQRVRTYGDFSGPSEDFAVGTHPYRAATAYFQQEPYPKNLLVGRFCDEANPLASILGGAMPAVLADFTEIENASFIMKADVSNSYEKIPSTSYLISGMDFTDALSFADINAIIEDKIKTALVDIIDNATVVLSSSGTKITLTIEDTTKILAVGFLEAGTEGTDISELLNMRIGSGGQLEYSTVAETVQDALTAIMNIDPSFTFICEDEDLSDTDAVSEISSWCQAQRVYMLSAESFDPRVKAGIDGSIFAGIREIEPSNTFGTYTDGKDYKNVSAAARLSSVNFSQSNSLITMMYKILQGCAPDSFSDTEAQTLLSNGVNYYSRRSGVSMYENGKTFSPNYWIDTKYWMIWFENAALVSVFNTLYTSKKLPQTEGGMAVLDAAIEAVCQQGVRNGGIAAGQLSPALTKDIQDSTGNTEFNGWLDKGYLVFHEPVAQQDQSDRSQRKGTPIKVWLKGSGAIQYAEAAIVFEQ